MSTKQNQFIGSRTVEFLGALLLLVAVLAPMVGVGYWINGQTQPVVRVEAALSRGITVAPGVSLTPGTSVTVPAGGPVARVVLTDFGDGTGATISRSTKLLWRSDAVVAGLSVGLGALMLRQVVTAVAAGQAFDRRNPRRIGVLAACVLLGGFLVPLLKGTAALFAVTDAALPAAVPVVASVPFDLWSVPVAGLILVLAEAFRAGVRLTEDVEGLV